MYKIPTPRYLSYIGVEVWRPVPKFEILYLVSNLGTVKSVKRTIETSNGKSKTYQSKLIKRTLSSGYFYVGLHRQGKRINVTVHSLVVKAFCGKAPPNHECRHLDGNRQNPCLYNLKWGTRKENVGDTIKHGRNHKPQGELHQDHILTEKDVTALRKLKAQGKCNYKMLADQYGVTQSTMYDAINKRTWKHI